jgi:hypothetical protein
VGRETSAETVRSITGGAASAWEAVLRWSKKSTGNSRANAKEIEDVAMVEVIAMDSQ